MKRKQLFLSPFLLLVLTLSLLIGMTAKAEAQENSFTEDLKAVALYSFGDEDAPLRRVENALYHTAAEQGKESDLLAGYEQQILALLQGECSEEGRRFLSRFLADTGSAASIPFFSSWLDEAGHFQLAVSTLEKFSTEEAAQALINALDGASEKKQLILLEALGRQKVASSAPILANYLQASDVKSAIAAHSLASLGTPEACLALAEALEALPVKKQIHLAPSALICAERLGEKGNFSLLELYRSADFPAHIRIAALSVLMRFQPDKTEELVVEGLVDKDPRLASASLGLARTVQGERVTASLLGLLDKVEDIQKASYLDVLSVRGGDAALEAAQRYADYNHLNTRLAAIRSIGNLGGASFVPFFLQRIVDTRRDEQRIAKEALTRLSDPETDGMLLATAQGDGDNKVRVCAIEMLSDRRALDSADALCALAYDAPASVRSEAVHALRILGKPAMAGQLLFLTLIPGLEDIKSVLPQSIVALVQRGVAGADDTGETNPIIRFYRELQEQEVIQELPESNRRAATCLLLDSLALIGDDASFEIVREALDHPESEIRKSALSAATKFQRTDSLEALQKRIATETEDPLRSQAYSGYLNVLRSATLLSGRVIDAHLDYAFEEAKTAAEQREFLAAASRAPSLRALQLTEALLDNPETAAEATRAALVLATALCGAWRVEASARITALLEEDLPDAMKVDANSALALLNSFDTHLMAWEYAGPYFEEGLMSHHLYEMELPPQVDAEEAAWKCLPLMIDAPLPSALEFDRLWGGEERVVFVRTLLQLEEAQKLILELGSNDGCKVWLNDEELFAIADGRPLVPGENKIPLSLKAGDNRLMIAVYQQGGAWRATARLLQSDGSVAEGVTVRTQ